MVRNSPALDDDLLMELTFECPKCGAVGSSSPVEAGGLARCPACPEVRAIRPEAIDAEGLLACPLCGTEDLYLQKDFPQGLGLAIVVAAIGISTVFWYQDRPVPALGILLLSALVDMVLYSRVGDVTICYRCLSQYRGAQANPAGRFHPFDLAIGERYRQERLRIEELKGRGSSAGSSVPPAP
ncbi:MAG: hypothetical protein AB7I30_23650 [Isosphaeraceae bacterium]